MTLLDCLAGKLYNYGCTARNFLQYECACEEGEKKKEVNLPATVYCLGYSHIQLSFPFPSIIQSGKRLKKEVGSV